MQLPSPVAHMRHTPNFSEYSLVLFWYKYQQQVMSRFQYGLVILYMYIMWEISTPACSMTKLLWNT